MSNNETNYREFWARYKNSMYEINPDAIIKYFLTYCTEEEMIADKDILVQYPRTVLRFREYSDDFLKKFLTIDDYMRNKWLIRNKNMKRDLTELDNYFYGPKLN
jgi:hypothetical protein